MKWNTAGKWGVILLIKSEWFVYARVGQRDRRGHGKMMSSQDEFIFSRGLKWCVICMHVRVCVCVQDGDIILGCCRGRLYWSLFFFGISVLQLLLARNSFFFKLSWRDMMPFFKKKEKKRKKEERRSSTAPGLIGVKTTHESLFQIHKCTWLWRGLKRLAGGSAATLNGTDDTET